MKEQQGGTSERLGRNVRALREDRGWSQDLLAGMVSEAMGREMKGVTILRLEKGTRPTSVDELVALSDVFGVEASDLIGQEPDQLLGVEELKSWLWQIESDFSTLEHSIEHFRAQQAGFGEAWHPTPSPGSSAQEAEESERELKERLTAREIARGDYLARIEVELVDPDRKPF